MMKMLMKRGMRIMWLTSEEQQIINSFWEKAGGLEPFPRSLERAIAFAVPVAVIKMPHLALSGIETWLKRRQIEYSFNCNSRFVRGCLVCYGGKGFIFCDGTDPVDEIRFTIAHEIAHFLIDYWYPRQKVSKKFGVGILEVFDGTRKPTVTERLYSVFESTRIGVVTNLMDRQDASEVTWAMEDQADKIGFELLSPAIDVLKTMDFSKTLYSQRFEILSQRLVGFYGLPVHAAKIYAGGLLRSIGKGSTWTESLQMR
jgi:hypothetical protein